MFRLVPVAAPLSSSVAMFRLVPVAANFVDRKDCPTLHVSKSDIEAVLVELNEWLRRKKRFNVYRNISFERLYSF